MYATYLILYIYTYIHIYIYIYIYSYIHTAYVQCMSNARDSTAHGIFSRAASCSEFGMYNGNIVDRIPSVDHT